MKLTTLSILIFTFSFSQEYKTLLLDSGHVSPKANLEAIAWLAGSWQGDAFGGTFEETWEAPSAGSMLGMFKHFAKGKVTFYELITIVEENESLIIRLKHFNKDLTGWEEKKVTVDFPLLKVEKNAMHFSGYSFIRISENRINCIVNVQGNDIVFKFNRRKN
jgi:hypothetical protein